MGWIGYLPLSGRRGYDNAPAGCVLVKCSLWAQPCSEEQNGLAYFKMPPTPKARGAFPDIYYGILIELLEIISQCCACLPPPQPSPPPPTNTHTIESSRSFNSQSCADWASSSGLLPWHWFHMTFPLMNLSYEPWLPVLTHLSLSRLGGSSLPYRLIFLVCLVFHLCYVISKSLLCRTGNQEWFPPFHKQQQGCLKDINDVEVT